MLVAGAIASFERTVLSGNSPVDRYNGGETDALSEPAVRGMELFKAPGITETLDWSQALLALGAKELDLESVDTTLGVVVNVQI